MGCLATRIPESRFLTPLRFRPNRLFRRDASYALSRDGEHYDVRSEGPGGEKRCIEVKGRTQSGAIVLSSPEVDKHRQLGEQAWLYVVTFFKGKRPRLRIIQDPLSRLNPEMLCRQIQYFVEESDWSRQGDEVVE